METRRTHAEAKAARETVIANVKAAIVNANATVNVGSLFDTCEKGLLMGNKQNFGHIVLQALKADGNFKVKGVRKIGTYACVADQELEIPMTKKAIKAAQPKKRRGRPVGSKNKVKTVCRRKFQMVLGFGKIVKDYVGVPANIAPSDGDWKISKSIPGMIAKRYNDTVELYRKDTPGQMSEYLQVTEKGSYLFKPVA